MILLHIILLKAYRKATYAIHLYYYEVKKTTAAVHKISRCYPETIFFGR